jgi:hypothetical protein
VNKVDVLSIQEWIRGEVAQTMYTHVSKCTNDKIKGEKKKRTNTEFLNLLKSP